MMWEPSDPRPDPKAKPNPAPHVLDMDSINAEVTLPEFSATKPGFFEG